MDSPHSTSCSTPWRAGCEAPVGGRTLTDAFASSALRGRIRAPVVVRRRSERSSAKVRGWIAPFRVVFDDWWANAHAATFVRRHLRLQSLSAQRVRKHSPHSAFAQHAQPFGQIVVRRLGRECARAGWVRSTRGGSRCTPACRQDDWQTVLTHHRLLPQALRARRMPLVVRDSKSRKSSLDDVLGECPATTICPLRGLRLCNALREVYG